MRPWRFTVGERKCAKRLKLRARKRLARDGEAGRRTRNGLQLPMLNKGGFMRPQLFAAGERRIGKATNPDNLYCARGEMENGIKARQIDLFADRTSCRRWRSSPFRLLLSSLDYMLALRHPPLEPQRSYCSYSPF